MAYHPETDGQTEQVNQILEQYLRVFINYQQDDRKNLLPLAEFAYNNTQHLAMSVTPFFANKGFHQKLEVSLESVPLESAHEMATDMKDLHQYLCDQLQLTIKQYECHLENWHLLIPGFKAGDSVWLDARNIKTKHPSKKLDHRHLSPFPIVEMVSSHAAWLGLPLALKCIHPVFHVSLLQPTDPSLIPNRSNDLLPPLEVDDSMEYEVYRILDSKIVHRRKGSGLLYLVEWSGFDNTANTTSWELEENVRNAPDLVRAFHHTYPDKPKPV